MLKSVEKRSGFNYKVVAQLLGALVWIETAFLILSMAVAIGYDGPDVHAFFISVLIAFAAGGLLILIGMDAEKRVGKRESYLTVALVWVVLSFFGCLPYQISGYIPDLPDAFFETISGFSTTGSTILPAGRIELLPHGLLFWRSLTQWLGGMGVIVLSLAILPMFGLGSMQLYQAEAPGATYEKLAPKIEDTAKIMWGLYCTLSAVECGLLRVFGMSWFDAVCHTFTTMSSGGFSTHSDSIAYFRSPAIEYTIAIFMLLTSLNYTLLYWVIRGKVRRLTQDDESRWFLWNVGALTLVITLVLIGKDLDWTFNLKGWEQIFRDAFFQVTSLFSTTGYSTVNYMHWPSALRVLVFFMMLFGAVAGSTAGGIKWVRFTVMVKNVWAEFRRMLHPNAILPTRLNGRILPNSVVLNVFAFLVVYFILFGFSTLIFSLQDGVNVIDGMFAAATALSNVGPGYGAYVSDFHAFSDISKWVMSFLMMVGRLELFTVLMLFFPSFWKR